MQGAARARDAVGGGEGPGGRRRRTRGAVGYRRQCNDRLLRLARVDNPALEFGPRPVGSDRGGGRGSPRSWT